MAPEPACPGLGVWTWSQCVELEAAHCLSTQHARSGPNAGTPDWAPSHPQCSVLDWACCVASAQHAGFWIGLCYAFPNLNALPIAPETPQASGIYPYCKVIFSPWGLPKTGWMLYLGDMLAEKVQQHDTNWETWQYRGGSGYTGWIKWPWELKKINGMMFSFTQCKIMN